MKIRSKDFQVKERGKVKLLDVPTKISPFYQSKDHYQELLQENTARIAELQRVLYASNQYAILLIFQGMDSSGKDGVIRHVMSGVNPQGVEVFSFKQPSKEELQHDFLWRTTCRLPERGRIGIFNRSYYEEVLVVRVHPELLLNQGLSDKNKKIWEGRYQSIVDLESHLYRNNTRILKFYLHISQDEQKKRLLSRIEEPSKNWKMSVADIKERGYWKKYMQANEECIKATSTDETPWYVIPADDKENARLIVSNILLNSLNDLDLAYPKLTKEHQKELQVIRKQLLR